MKSKLQSIIFCATLKCHHVPGVYFRGGSYTCVCRPGYSPPPNVTSGFPGLLVEQKFMTKLRTNMTDTGYDALQCSPRLPQSDCEWNCSAESPCLMNYRPVMRGVPLGVQSFCLTVVLILALVVLRLRRKKVMKISMWLILEIMLSGALFLYSTVVIQYFEPTSLTCILLAWFRELGFAILYGILLLKIYKVLVDFQARKAHRVHVRDKDLLRYLFIIIVVVVGYLSAWTAVTLDAQTSQAVVVQGGLPDHRVYRVCRGGWWHYVTDFLELAVLLVGLYLCYCVKDAPSEYRETTYISVSVLLEVLVSGFLHVARHFLWTRFDPDYMYLLYFLRSQLTVTTTLTLLLGPKLWYAHRRGDEMRGRAWSSTDAHDNLHPETLKLNVALSSNGDVEGSTDMPLADMPPDHVRTELKRMYAQLQLYKTKAMRKDNPHISKRRGGRKQTHRRFSLQPFHRHHKTVTHEAEALELSRTPEDSTNSGDAQNVSEACSRIEEEEENSISPAPSPLPLPGRKKQSAV